MSLDGKSISQKRFRGESVAELRNELNDFALQLQTGQLTFRGLKLEVRPSVPSTFAAGDPVLVVVNVSGTWKLYVATGSTYVVAGTQT